MKRCSHAVLALLLLPGAADASEARFKLVGEIFPRCDSSLSAGEESAKTSLQISESGTTDIRFTLECNTEALISVESLRGGFTNQRAVSQNWTGGRAVIDYSVSVSVDGQSIFSDKSASELQAKDGSGQFNTGLLSTEDGSLDVALHWEGGKDLYAGRYEDVLRVTVTPAN